MSYAVRVESLTKSYGSHTVLKGLDFQVKKGEIFGVLGINGAGKTTTLECMEGLRKYDSGKITADGRVGIQLQSASLPAFIKPMEVIQLFAKWNHTKVNKSVLSALGINELKKMKYADLSTGQKRRLHLALALISSPDIIFLDEPTAGLDVGGRISLHGQIRKLKDQGKTMILASHDMAEVEKLCDRIAILHEGSIAFMGTVSELTVKAGGQYDIKITTELGEDHYSSDQIGETMFHLLKNYQKRDIRVLDIEINRGKLEQFFMNITKGV